MKNNITRSLAAFLVASFIASSALAADPKPTPAPAVSPTPSAAPSTATPVDPEVAKLKEQVAELTQALQGAIQQRNAALADKANLELQLAIAGTKIDALSKLPPPAK